MKGLYRKSILATFASVAIGFTSIMGVSAEKVTGEDEVTIGVVRGIMELTAPSLEQSYLNVEVSTDVKSYGLSYNAPFKVKDLRGTHEGWRLDVTASQFEMVKDTDERYRLPSGTLAINPLDSIEVLGESSSGAPINSLDGLTVIDDGTITVASAKEGTGVGEFELTFPEEAVTVTIDPSTVKVDKDDTEGTFYKTVMNWTLVDAP